VEPHRGRACEQAGEEFASLHGGILFGEFSGCQI
jgi:hypothetical protein